MFGTYACVVCGCEAGEDVVKLSSTALQVGEIVSPACSQFLLSVELHQGAGAQRQQAVRHTAAQQSGVGLISTLREVRNDDD